MFALVTTTGQRQVMKNGWWRVVFFLTGQTSDLCFDFIGQAWSKQMGVGVAVVGAIGGTGEGDEASKEN